MFFYQPIVLKNGQKCILRNAEASDAVRHHDYFVQTHKETDFLLTYPDECTMDIISLERKSYGKKKALWKFTTEFENGIYGILGPNGAGKSCQRIL